MGLDQVILDKVGLLNTKKEKILSNIQVQYECTSLGCKFDVIISLEM